MKIYNHSLNIASDEIKKKATLTTNYNEADVVLMEWSPVTKNDIKNATNLKKKTTVVFDRNLEIEVDDANWLRKQGIILTEPALNFRRKFFHYIPFWVLAKNLDAVQLNDVSERPYDLVYKGDMRGKIPSFRDYYVKYAKTYPKTVFYENKSLSKIDIEKYVTYGLIKKDVIEYKDAKTTLIIGSALDYEIGYLDSQFFDALNENCIPIVVNEHKYFSLLSPYRINEPMFDINYIISGYNNAYVGFILDIYETIRKYYPEMLIENVVSQIIDLVK